MMDDKFCSICLLTESKFYVFANDEPKMFIKNVIKLSGCKLLSYGEEYICYECKALLEKSYNFVQKALTAQHILQEILQEFKEISVKILKDIDRNDFSLSKLTVHKLCNLNIYEKPKPNKNIEDTNDYKEVNRKQKRKINNLRKKTNPHENPRKPLHPHETGEKEDVITITSDNECAPCEYEDVQDKIRAKRKKKKSERLVSKRLKAKKKIIKNKPKVYKKTTYEPSVFVQSLNAVGDKRRRKEVKYDKILGDDSSDDAAPSKNIPETEVNDEYEPSSESSDAISVDFYNDQGIRSRHFDGRVFPMQCEQCEAEISGKTMHIYHYMEMHRGIPYPYPLQGKRVLCQICGKEVIERRFATHMENFHENIWFPCHICQKKFKSRVKLLSHVNVVHGDRYVECDYCGKRSKTKTDLRIHIRTHTGEKPYKCHICGAGFAHNGNVGIHIRSRHQQSIVSDNESKSRKRKPKKKKNLGITDDSQRQKGNKRKLSSIDSDTQSTTSNEKARKRKPKKIQKKQMIESDTNIESHGPKRSSKDSKASSTTTSREQNLKKTRKDSNSDSDSESDSCPLASLRNNL